MAFYGCGQSKPGPDPEQLPVREKTGAAPKPERTAAPEPTDMLSLQTVGIWAREWFKDGRQMDLKKLPERPASKTFQDGGSRNAPSRGSATTGA